MTPLTVRRWLHGVHALTTILLIATGLLVSHPDLRGSLIGGYGRQVLDGHLWLGWLFMGTPVLALAIAARPILRDLRRRLGPPDPVYAWRKIHLVTTQIMALLVGASGVVLWLDADLPLVFSDAMLEVHIVINWMLIVSIPLHVALAWRKTLARAREILGIDESPYPGGFEDEDFDPLQ